MKSSALSLLLCLLLLTGCAAPAAQVEAPGPSIHDASPSTAPPEQAQAIRLPASIDPIGFTRDPDVLQMDIADLAAKYGAKDPTMPDLYEIPGYVLGDYEARLFIQANAGNVRQIVAAQTQEVPTSAFEGVYLSMVEELGQPDEAFGANSYCEFVSIAPDNLLTHTGEVMARWYLEDRIFEIGEEIVGSQPSKWYVAAYVDRLNTEQSTPILLAMTAVPMAHPHISTPWVFITTRNSLLPKRKPFLLTTGRKQFALRI